MKKNILRRMVVGTAVLAMSAAMGIASAAEVETATFAVHNEAKGTTATLVVVTEDDGSYVVYVDGVKFTGEEAHAALTRNNIQITVNSLGHIVKNSVAQGVEVVVPPKAVTPSEDAGTEAAPSAAVAPSLPSNSMAGSGIADVGASHGTSGDAIDVAPVRPDYTVSK